MIPREVLEYLRVPTGYDAFFSTSAVPYDGSTATTLTASSSHERTSSFLSLALSKYTPGSCALNGRRRTDCKIHCHSPCVFYH